MTSSTADRAAKTLAGGKFIGDPDELSVSAGDAGAAYAEPTGSMAATAQATLYIAQWTATAGAWQTAANWTVTDPGEPAHSLPGVNDVVSIANNGSTGYTVAYNSTATIAAIKTGTAVTLSMQSGSLIARFGGTIGLELDVASAATLGVGVGYTLNIYKSSFLGTVIGRGKVELSGGRHTIGANRISVATLEVASGSTTLNTSLDYSGDFLLDGGALLQLNGETLNLAGNASLNGVIQGPGTVNVTGAATLSDDFLLTQGASLFDGKGATFTQTGNVAIGNGPIAAGTLGIRVGATYNVVATATLGDAIAGNATIGNSGTLSVGAEDVLTLEAHFSSAGAIDIGSGGKLDLTLGAAVLKGTLQGGGILEINTGENAYLSAAVTGGVEVLIAGGSTTLGEDLTGLQMQGGTLNLGGHTLTGATLLGGTVFGGEVDGGELGGGVTLGTASAPVTIEAGSVTQTGNAVLNGVLNITGSYTMSDDSDVNGFNTIALGGNAAITNSGELSVMTINYSGLFPDIFAVSGSFTNSGTLSVEPDYEINRTPGELKFLGNVTLQAGSTVTGVGIANFAGQTTIDGLEIIPINVGFLGEAYPLLMFSDVTTFNVSVSLVEAIFGSGTLNISSGQTLTLSGANSIGSQILDGGGTLSVTDSVSLGSANASTTLSIGSNTATDIVDSGAIVQYSSVALRGSLKIGSGDSYTIKQSGYLAGTSAIINNAGDFTVDTASGSTTISGSFANSGHFIVDPTSGTTTVSASFTNSNEIFAEAGSLVFNSQVLGTGLETIENSAYLQLNGASSASQTIDFSSSGAAELGLADAAHFQSGIVGFGAVSTEAIDLIGFGANSTKSFGSFSGGVIVNISDGTNSASLHFAGSYSQGDFHLNTGSNGELLSYSV